MHNHVAEKQFQGFEDIKQIDENGIEFWYARDLYPLLGYASWQNFRSVLEKAREACKNSNINELDHFMEKHKMVVLGSGSKRKINDVALSRYACYLIVQNGDPSKPVIANGQTYFAIQTRRQEIEDAKRFEQLSEDEKRTLLREDLRTSNRHLADAAHASGIIDPHDYAIFQNYGYKGLYGGLGVRDIHQRKKLKKDEKILDHMNSEELAANLFRSTQTEAKLRRDNIHGKSLANQTHFSVGQAVRETIKQLGGTMPEDLPKPEKSIQQLKSEKKKTLLGHEK